MKLFFFYERLTRKYFQTIVMQVITMCFGLVMAVIVTCWIFLLCINSIQSYSECFNNVVIPLELFSILKDYLQAFLFKKMQSGNEILNSFIRGQTTGK